MSKIRYIGQYDYSGHKNITGYDSTGVEMAFFWMDENELQTHRNQEARRWGFTIEQLSIGKFQFFVTGKLEIIYE